MYTHMIIIIIIITIITITIIIIIIIILSTIITSSRPPGSPEANREPGRHVAAAQAPEGGRPIL